MILFAGTIAGIVGIFAFFFLSLRFQDKANEAKLNSLAFVKYLIEKNREKQ
jgi:hypothetical protein